MSGKHVPGRIRLDFVELLSPDLRGPERALGSLELASASVPGVMDQSIEQRSYVQDFDTIRGIDGGAEVADPLIGTIRAGRSASLTLIEGRLHLDLIWSELIEPIQDFRTCLGRKRPFAVRIQLPELRLSQTRIDLASGRITSPVGGARPPSKPLDLRSGRVLVPIGKTIRRGCTGDEIGHLGVWIVIQDD